MNGDLFSKNENSFSVQFSLLEHDLMYYFKKRDYPNALRKINFFHEHLLSLLDSISISFLKNSIIGIVGDFTGVALLNSLNTVDFIKLRHRLLLDPLINTPTPKTFFKIVEQVTFIFFDAIDSLDGNIDITKLPKQVAAVAYYINSHPYEKNRAKDILLKFDLTSQDLKKFKSYIGLSVDDYIQHTKLKTARDLLLHTKLKVSEIAKRLNYYDLATFSKQFRIVYDLSPLQYRTKNKINDFFKYL